MGYIYRPLAGSALIYEMRKIFSENIGHCAGALRASNQICDGSDGHIMQPSKMAAIMLLNSGTFYYKHSPASQHLLCTRVGVCLSPLDSLKLDRSLVLFVSAPQKGVCTLGL